MKRLALLSVVVLSACCHPNEKMAAEVAPATEDGQYVIVSGKSYEQVWSSALHGVMRATNESDLNANNWLTVIRHTQAEGLIKAESSKMNMPEWGEEIAVSIYPTGDAPAYTVVVQSVKKGKGNLTRHNWDERVLDSIEDNVI